MKKTMMSLILILAALSYGFSISESFEGDVVPAEGWSVIYDNAEPSSGNLVAHNDKYAKSGLKSFRFSSFTNGSPYGEYLISPEITADAELKASFWYRRHSVSGAETFSVGVSTSGNDVTSDFTWSEDIVSTNLDWEQYSQTLTVDAKYIAINYKSDYSYYMYVDDFTIAVPVDMSFVDATSTQNNTDILIQSQTDAEMMRIVVNTDGSEAPLMLNELKLSTAGTTATADITAARVYYSGSIDTFDDTQQFGEIVTTVDGEFSVIGTQELLAGANYFWLTYDISATAGVDNIIDASVMEIKIGDELHTPVVTSPEGNRVVKAALNGTFTIAADGDYATINDAVTAISTYGVSSPVVFNIADGVYDEQVTIPEIFGASEINTITFKGNAANNESVVINFDNVYNKNWVIRLKGADYITFENLTVQSVNTSYARAVVIIEGADHNTFKNNRFVGMEVTGSDVLSAYYLVSTGGTFSEVIENDNSFIENDFINGSVGLYTKGVSIHVPFETGHTIKNNTFTNQFEKAIYAGYSNNLEISGNDITTNTTSDYYYAIECFNADSNIVIVKNNINITSTKGTVGIKTKYSGADAADVDHFLIANNFIQINSEEKSLGINLYRAFKFDVFHNTINMTGAAADNVNLTIGAQTKESLIKNNIFTNNSGGYAVAVSDAVEMGNEVDFNNMYTTGSKIAAYGTDEAADLEAWKTLAGTDANSISLAITYAGTDDLHTSGENLRIGTFFDRVTEDIDGELRNTITTVIGADEYEGVAVEFATPQSVNAEVIIDDVTVSWMMTADGSKSFSTIKEALKSVSKDKEIEGLTGFKLYRNEEILTTITDATVRSYADNDLAEGDYNYYLIAVYEAGESEASATTSVTVEEEVIEDGTWFEHGSNFTSATSWDGGSAYQIAADFDLGKKSDWTVKKLVTATTHTQTIPWKIVTFTDKPVDSDVIGTLSGTITTLDASEEGFNDASLEINDNTALSGKIAVVFDIPEYDNGGDTTKTNAMVYDDVNGGSHAWLQNLDIEEPMAWVNVNVIDVQAWRLKLLLATSNGIVEVLPGSTELYQNYPNPFNPSTSIKFYNNISGNVKLSVFNVKGELVSTLVNKQMTASKHVINFNASNLNSGVYYYTLETPAKTITKKMIMVK